MTYGATTTEQAASCATPCHFDLFEFNTASPDEFVAECRRLNQPYRLLENGQGLDLNEVLRPH